MTKEQAKKYGGEILSIFPEDIAIVEVALILSELLASVLELQAGFAQQTDSGGSETVCEINSLHNSLAIDGYKLCPGCNISLR